jgi:hypothetical protein
MKYAGGELPGIGLGVSLYDTLLDLVPSFVSGPAQRAEGWGAVEFGLPQVRNGIFSLRWKTIIILPRQARDKRRGN